MNYLWDVAQAGLGWASGYFRGEKGEQLLDPIGTLCMLTLRNFTSYDKAKPAVAKNLFYWTKHTIKIIEGAKRATQFVDHDDIGYLEKPIEDLITYWRPVQGSPLVLIAAEAIRGLEKVHTAYEGKVNGVKSTAELYRIKLQRWLDLLPKEERKKDIDAMEVEKTQVAAPEIKAIPPDTDFIRKVKILWSDTNITLFHTLYKNQVVEPIETFLTSQHGAYSKIISLGEKTEFI